MDADVGTLSEEVVVVAEFDVEARWPELFEDLTAEQRHTILNTLASSYYEGWEPDREAVADLIAVDQGEISETEYLRRSDARTAAKFSSSTHGAARA